MAEVHPESVQEVNPTPEFVEDDLPLPSFLEVFGFTVTPNQAPLPTAPVANVRKRTSEVENSRTQQLGNYYVKTLTKRLKVIETTNDGKPIRQETGRWTPEEHKLFLEGVMLYGKDWKKMQALIKTRSLIQIRTHAQKVFKKIGIQPQKRLDSSGNRGKIANSSSQGQDGAEYSGTAMESSGYRNYDMGEEVTDEEFNLVVQHLKNLGEMRGDDLIEEEDTADDPPQSQLQQDLLLSSHPSPTSMNILRLNEAGSNNNELSSSFHITDYDPRNSLLSTRGLDSTAMHMAYNDSSTSSYLPAVQNSSSGHNYLQDFSMMDTADQDPWPRSAHSDHSQQEQSQHLQEQQQSEQQLGHDFSPSATEEELHNHQLLQTLRQLMPDNFDHSVDFSTGFSALDGGNSNNHRSGRK